jgi:hypothetical protein
MKTITTLIITLLIIFSTVSYAQHSPILVSPERYLASITLEQLYQPEAKLIANDMKQILELRTENENDKSPDKIKLNKEKEQQLLKDIKEAIIRCAKYKEIMDNDIKFVF